MIDLANEFHKASYEVTLVAGRIVPRNKSLSEDIRFRKIICYNRSSSIKRLFTWTWGSFQILKFIWLNCRKKELLIVTNPPFAPLLTLFCRNEFSLLIYDVYPDVLAEYGIFSSDSIWVRCWQRMNRKVYSKAKRIITLTEGMKDLLRKYTIDRTVEVIPIWTDNNHLKPIAKSSNPFIRNNNLTGKFIVLYSGNLGFTHDVEVIVELANIMRDVEVDFLIIGDGDKKDNLIKMIKEYKLLNCRMLPFQDTKDLPFSLAAADIAIVTLGKDASKLSIPSKTFNLMSVGAPLLCIGGYDSELCKLVYHHHIGRCFDAKELDKMADFIHEIKQSPVKQKFFAENSRKASLNYGVENIKQFI